MTREETLSTRAPPPLLPNKPEQGGTMNLEKAPEPGGMDYYDSNPTTLTQVLGRRSQLRAMVWITQAGDDLQTGRVELNGPSTDSSEPPASDTSSRDENDASSSDNGVPTPTAVRTAAHQLGAHMIGPGDGEDIREGSTRAQTRALNREAETGLSYNRAL